MHFKGSHIWYATKQSTGRHIYIKDHRISRRPEESHITIRSDDWIVKDTCNNIKQSDERVNHNAALQSWY